MPENRDIGLHRLTTPRAAGVAGVLFAILLGVALVLIRTSVPDGTSTDTAWLDGSIVQLRFASILMPFAGICFLWFIGVVRDGLGRYEDRFFGSVCLGSGLVFLAMVFAASAVGAALVASRTTNVDPEAQAQVAVFGQSLLVTLTKTFAIRMGAVFMFSLATIWLRTNLMPKWVVWCSYGLALTLLVGADITMWLALAMPLWVFLVSLLSLSRSGAIHLHLTHDLPESPENGAPTKN